MVEEFGRRAILTTSALVAFASATTACAQSNGTTRRSGSTTLIAYFSRSGNTRVIAETLERLLQADLFQILPLRPYPEDYEQTVEQARQERDRGYEPPLSTGRLDVTAYDTIFLGFPIWGETAPPVIRTFLKSHDLSKKTLRPFITHGGYGVGQSAAVLASHAVGARMETPFAIEADQERRTLNAVKSWIGNANLK